MREWIGIAFIIAILTVAVALFIVGPGMIAYIITGALKYALITTAAWSVTLIAFILIFGVNINIKANKKDEGG